MEEAKQNLDAIADQNPPEISELPFSLLERQENKTTKLIANSGKTVPVEGRNSKFKYSFKEPVVLSYISLSVTGYNEFDRFRFEVKTLAGDRKSFVVKPADSKVYCDIDEICEGVSFEPPQAWLRSPMIQSVELSGFKISEAGKFIRFAVNLDEVRDELLRQARAEEAKAQETIDLAAQERINLESVNSEINDAKLTLAATQNEQKVATNKLNELAAKIGASAKQIEGTEERLSNIQGDVKVETQRKEKLQSDIVDSQAKVRELEANINLFPSEISGFADQAGSNNRTYLIYASVPLLILLGMFVLLISGAVELTTIITDDKNVNLAAIIVSRMPYVAVATAIIYASYRIAKVFITEIMHINRQRLSMTKVSIIAKDVSQAAEFGLKMTESEIYARRLKVKMALLGDHINALVASDPDVLFPETLFGALSPDAPEVNLTKLPSKTIKVTRQPAKAATQTAKE